MLIKIVSALVTRQSYCIFDPFILFFSFYRVQIIILLANTCNKLFHRCKIVISSTISSPKLHKLRQIKLIILGQKYIFILKFFFTFYLPLKYNEHCLEFFDTSDKCVCHVLKNARLIDGGNKTRKSLMFLFFFSLSIQYDTISKWRQKRQGNDKEDEIYIPRWSIGQTNYRTLCHLYYTEDRKRNNLSLSFSLQWHILVCPRSLNDNRSSQIPTRVE